MLAVITEIRDNPVQLYLNVNAAHVELPHFQTILLDKTTMDRDRTDGDEKIKNAQNCSAGQSRRRNELINRMIISGIPRGIEAKVGMIQTAKSINHSEDRRERRHKKKGKKCYNSLTYSAFIIPSMRIKDPAIKPRRGLPRGNTPKRIDAPTRIVMMAENR